ncbi:MAG: hypothetical protein FJX35_18460 [Alphaproteobacteria bacterium]|nr:hypothetical protein [Alphaproteobacteria bacterium]
MSSKGSEAAAGDGALAPKAERRRVTGLPVPVLAAGSVVLIAALIGIGLGLGAAVRSIVDAPKPPQPQPVVVIAPRMVKLPDLVGRRLIDGHQRGVLVAAALELPTTGSELILRSRMPRFLEMATSRLEERLDTYLKSADAPLQVAADLRALADQIIAATPCTDLALATQYEGCVKGSELPINKVVIFKMIEF